MIYFITDSIGPTKIGWSTAPEIRLAELRREPGGEHLEIVARFAVDGWVEAALHKHLREHRIFGEWFDTVAALDVIAQLEVGWLPEGDRTKRVRGRPTKEARRFNHTVQVRAKPDDLDRWDAAASHAGMERSEWVRHVLDEAAELGTRGLGR